MGNVDQLFSDYVNWWGRTVSVQKRKQKSYIRQPKLTPERRRNLEDMVNWCRDRNIDSRKWLYFLFKSRRWTFAPQFTPGSLKSEKMLLKYIKEKDYSPFFSYLREEREIQQSFSPYRFNQWSDLAHGSEDAKRAYRLAGAPHICAARLEETQGYHPKSAWCATCSVAVACWRNLPPIVALVRSQLGG